MISLATLGSVEVTVNGRPAPAELLWRKHLALLIYLARSPRGRSREHLVGLLWPDKDDARARHSLNEALRILRRSLGAALVTDGDTVLLVPEAIVTDCDDLEAQAAESLGQPFLDGFTVPDAPAFEDWVAQERRRCTGAQLAALGDRAAVALREGNAGAACRLAEAALALEPRHEPAARLAMRAYALDGARALALEVADRLNAALAALGAAPEPATRALSARIRHAGFGAAAGPVRPRDAAVPLMGRARAQLDGLCRLWEECGRGAPRVALVTGDPGTGKTRLADELAARARLDGAVVAAARAMEGDDDVTLWRALLGGGLDAPELAGAAPAVLAGLAPLDPDLPARFPAARLTAPLPVADALAGAIVAVADQRPLLLILDDAHLAAPDVVPQLLALAQRAGARPLFVFLTARGPSGSAQPSLDEATSRIGRDVSGGLFSTGCLEDAALHDLVRWAFPAYAPAAVARLVRRVAADTAGNPFLAVELVRAIRAGLPLSDRPARAWPARHHTLDDTRPGDLPESVAAALRLRFRELSEPAQRALAAVAVLGGRVPAGTLARGAAIGGRELDAALDELEWTRWLVADARGYGFATGLAREVVLQDMVTGGQRRRIRERARESQAVTGKT